MKEASKQYDKILNLLKAFVRHRVLSILMEQLHVQSHQSLSKDSIFLPIPQNSCTLKTLLQNDVERFGIRDDLDFCNRLFQILNQRVLDKIRQNRKVNEIFTFL